MLVNHYTLGHKFFSRAAALLLCSAICVADPPSKTLRVTGVIEPVRSYIVQVPRVEGQGGNVTLTKLVDNGENISEGQLLAEFDSTKEEQALRDAAAKYDDFSHQVEQKAAEHRYNVAKRTSDLQQAKADLNKAQLEMRKGPVLMEIEQKKNQIKVQDGRDHVASLEKSNAFHEQSEAAESHILELQRDRQKVAMQRAQANIAKLQLKAPLSGMAALKNVWKNGSMGHAQEGDQLWPGSPLLQLFDPKEMEVTAQIQEPDMIALGPDTVAVVHLDAYPGTSFKATFESASPVASSAVDSPIKTFSARFRLLGSDPHLLPDLSAAVDIVVNSKTDSKLDGKL